MSDPIVYSAESDDSDWPIINGARNDTLRFHRWLFLTGRYDQDVDLQLIYSTDNQRDAQNLANRN